MVWTRVEQKRFKDEESQGVFLEAFEEPMGQGEYESASEICEGDRRAICQLTQIALDNRKLGFAKVKQLVADRFQRDVLADLDFRLSWVYTVIKAAPMVGLLGTVMGMMGAAMLNVATAVSSTPPSARGGAPRADIGATVGVAEASGASVMADAAVHTAQAGKRAKRWADEEDDSISSSAGNGVNDEAEAVEHGNEFGRQGPRYQLQL